MKILFVHERFGSLAGAEANAWITATELKSRGHTVGVIHGEPTGKGEANWQQTFQSRYALERLNARSNPQAVTKALADFQPDVVYVHKMADLRVIETLVRSGIPLVRMVHDHDIYCMRSYKYNYRTREICTRAAGPYCILPCGAFIARNTQPGGLPIKYVSYFDKKKEIRLNHRFKRMVVVTRYMRDELLRNGFSPEKIEIHSPVPRMGDPSLRSSFSDRNLIIFAGQIIRGKGVDILLEALALLKVPFECVILGDGSHKAHCEKLAVQLGLSGRVCFMGFIPQEEMKKFYRECTAVAISSVWPEPFATIGVEALRYGIPVVAFDAGGIKDWLIDGMNGFLVPWMDRRKFADRLEQLLLDKNLARDMGERGLKFVSERYNFSQYISELEEMFERVVQENSARPVAAAEVTA